MAFLLHSSGIQLRSVVILGPPIGTNLAELKEYFGKIGEIVSLKLVSAGPELVCEYRETPIAREAAQKLNGEDFQHVKLTVKYGADAGEYFTEITASRPTDEVLEDVIEMLRSQGFTVQKQPCTEDVVTGLPHHPTPATYHPAPTTYVPPPRISPFSGEKVAKAGEVSFEAWVYGCTGVSREEATVKSL